MIFRLKMKNWLIQQEKVIKNNCLLQQEKNYKKESVDFF